MPPNNVNINGDLNGSVEQHIHTNRYVPLAIAIVISVLIITTAVLAVVFAPEPRQAEYYVTFRSRIIHNQTCIHYGRSQGRFTAEPEGRDCRICGGRKKPDNRKK